MATTPEDRSGLREAIAALFARDDSDEEISGEIETPQDVVRLLRQLMSERQKVCIIVQMHGGTIQGVFHDNDRVEITDVYFLEPLKYLGSEGDPEFVIDQSHDLGQHGIYTHTTSTPVRRHFFEPVIKAAEARLEYFELES